MKVRAASEPLCSNAIRYHFSASSGRRARRSRSALLGGWYAHRDVGVADLVLGLGDPLPDRGLRLQQCPRYLGDSADTYASWDANTTVGKHPIAPVGLSTRPLERMPSELSMHNGPMAAASHLGRQSQSALRSGRRRQTGRRLPRTAGRAQRSHVGVWGVLASLVRRTADR